MEQQALRWCRTAPGPSWLVAGLVVATVVTGSAWAGEPGPRPGGGVTIRVGGPVHVLPDDELDVLVVVGGDAQVEGTVTGALVLVGGQGRVDGTVLGNVMVVGGALTVGPTARVLGSVSLTGAQLDRRPGAVIEGAVVHRDARAPVWRFRFFLWLALTLAVAAGALVFQAAGRRTLDETGQLLIAEPIASLASTLAVWLGAPAISLVAMLTVIGIPAALGMLFIALPLLWLAGYIAAGAAVGTGLARAVARGGRSWSPGATLATGLAILQGVALLPVLGLPMVLIAGHLGGGALVYGVWRRRRSAPPAGAARSAEGGQARWQGARTSADDHATEPLHQSP